MRRPAAALLGTVVGTVLLVGAKYGSASPAANTADTVAAGPSESGPDASSAPPLDPGAPPGTPGKSPTAGKATPTPGRTAGTTSTTAAAPPACTTKSGSAAAIADPGVGTITVTIQVCGGVLKSATGTQSRSNWSKNTAAVPALNSLAVTNYKTNFSAIHYSGATLTSNAYQASLRSALNQAGI
ncbi:hypothetical protein [Dactylosporangium sp. CA-139066]|uniref:hypothetical protein n=1 Tax=Dactylosporangium sp. CA-139066 TaxID=3239930 RepID=UPI003D911C9C